VSTARALAALGLALWLGGGLGVMLSTRAVFRNLRGQPLAGTIAAEMLRGLAALTALALVLLVLATALGLRGFAVAAWIAGALVFGASELIVKRALHRMREEMGGSTEKVPAGDPRRKRFGALHGVSMLLLLVQLACAAAALVAVAQ
jgi:hypothetical protein